MQKSKILKSFLSNLKKDFREMSELSINFIYKGYISFDDEEIMGFECSCVGIDGYEDVLYIHDNNSFYYEGETPYGEISGKTTFQIPEKLLTLLPKPLMEMLRRVANSKISEKFSFEKETYKNIFLG